MSAPPAAVFPGELKKYSKKELQELCLELQLNVNNSKGKKLVKDDLFHVSDASGAAQSTCDVRSAIPRPCSSASMIASATSSMTPPQEKKVDLTEIFVFSFQLDMSRMLQEPPAPPVMSARPYWGPTRRRPQLSIVQTPPSQIFKMRHLIWILNSFFPPELAVQQALYVLGVIISLYPIARLHLNQMHEARRQSPLTGWMRSIHTLLTRAFHEEANNVEAWTTRINLAGEYSDYISRDLHQLYTMLGLTDDTADPASFLFRPARHILCSPRLNCKFCPPVDRNLVPSLRRRSKGKVQRVWLLDSTFKWVSADLLVGHCATCKADYYPDMITQKAVAGGRKCTQVLEYEPEFLRVSKQGVWVHCDIACAQEKALQCFHSGWSNFAEWVNNTTNDINVTFTTRQSQRLFTEHFSRRLLVAHGKRESFSCEAHPTMKLLAQAVRNMIGENGGVVPGSMKHGCRDCTTSGAPPKLRKWPVRGVILSYDNPLRDHVRRADASQLLVNVMDQNGARSALRSPVAHTEPGAEGSGEAQPQVTRFTRPVDSLRARMGSECCVVFRGILTKLPSWVNTSESL
ncbi:hypothetical protein B0H14DRAFT_3569770 [Mycena olivaceomarginata]|nr:hypothetical protein B0H14DRAFT_3569770 [Mycena olivaceomarginata]